MANITGYGNSTLNEMNITFHQRIPAGIYVLLLALDIFLAITAFLGNALILIALHKVKSIYPPTKLLFRCLAVTDLCVGLIVQPLNVLVVYTDYIDYAESFYVFQFSTFLFCALSLLTSTAISVDRLLALSLGQRYRYVITLRRVRAVIVCFWLIGALFGSMHVFSIRNGYMVIFNILVCVLIILCVVISLCSYIKIFITLRRQQAQLQHHVQPGQPNGGGNPLNIARYKKTVSTIAWVQLALFVCYLPYSIVVLLDVYGIINYSNAIVILIRDSLVLTLVFLNSALNPLLYCWRIKDARQEVKNTIHKVCCS